MKRSILFLTILLLTAFESRSQGAIDGFLKSQDEVDLALSYSVDRAEHYFLSEGKIEYGRNAQSLSLFANYGLHRYLNVIVNIPLVNFTPQDASVYAKSGIEKQWGGLKLKGIGALGYTIPLSDYNTESGTAIGQQTQAVNVRGLVQAELNSMWFGQFQMGYDATKEPVIPSQLWSAKAGFFKGKWYADLWYEVREAEGGKNYLGTGPEKPDSFRELGVDMERMGGVIYYQWKPDWGVFLSGAYMLSGRNTFENRTVGAGVVWKGKLK